MTTALAVTSRNLSASSALTILTRGSDFMEKMSDIDKLLLLEGEDDSQAFTFKPTRIKVSAGGGKSFQTEDGTMIPSPMTGTIIFGVKTRAYWPETNGNKVPFCSSVGNVTGLVNPNFIESDIAFGSHAQSPHLAIIDLNNGGMIRPSYSCDSCPMNEFGSDHQRGGRGKGCKEKVAIFFLPTGWHQPAILSVPTMSIPAWNSFCSSLRQMSGKPYYAFKTKIEVEVKKNSNDISYGQMVFTPTDEISDVDVIRAVLALQGEAKEYLKANNIDVHVDDGTEFVESPNGSVIDGLTGEILN